MAAFEMLTLFHHPFCPHSRFVRFALGEYGLSVRQVWEQVWERREEFLILNPAGTTPVLVINEQLPIPGASIIAEYLDEVYGSHLGDRRFLPVSSHERLEVRRLADWFNGKFFAEVSGPLMDQRYRQIMPIDAGSGSPDYAAFHAAREIVIDHIAYIDLLLGNNDYLVGNRLTYADLAAAAHLSMLESFRIAWTSAGPAQEWYTRMRSRPSLELVLSARSLSKRQDARPQGVTNAARAG